MSPRATRSRAWSGIAAAKSNGGALTYGGIGFQAGAFSGIPGGALIGGAAGTIYGISKASKELDREIANIRLGDSLKKLGRVIDDVADGRGSRGSASAINRYVGQVSKDSAAYSRGAGDNLADNIHNAMGRFSPLTDIFTGAFRSSATSRVQAENDASQAKERETLTPLLPSLRQAFQSSLIKTVDPKLFVGGTRDPAAQRSFRRSQITANGGDQLIETIARVQKQSFAEVLADFDKELVQKAQSEYSDKTLKRLDDMVDVDIRKLDKLAQALESAAESTRKFSDQADAIESLATGRITSTTISGQADRLGNLGRGDAGSVKGAIGFLQNSLGKLGSGTVGRFSDSLQEVDTIKRTLTGRLLDAANGGGSGATEESIKGTLSNAFNGFSDTAKTRLQGRLESMDPKTVLQELSSNPEKLTDDLTSVFDGMQKAGESIAKSLEQQFASYGDGLVRGNALQDRSRITSDSRVGIEVQRQNFLNANLGSLSHSDMTTPLSTRLAPYDAEQRRLGETAGDAFNPTAIRDRLGTVHRDALKQQSIVDDTRSSATQRQAAQGEFVKLTQEAAKLTDGLKHLTDTSSSLAEIQQEIDRHERGRQSVIGLGERLLTNDPSANMEYRKGQIAAEAAVNQGNFSGFSAENIRRALETLRAAGDAQVFGGTSTGNQTAQGLVENSLPLVGLSTNGYRRQIGDLLGQGDKIQGRADEAAGVLSSVQDQQAKMFFDRLDRGFTAFFQNAEKKVGEDDVSDKGRIASSARLEFNKRVVDRNTVNDLAGKFQANPRDVNGLQKARQVLADPQLGELGTALEERRQFAASASLKTKKKTKDQFPVQGYSGEFDFSGVDIGYGDGDLRDPEVMAAYEAKVRGQSKKIAQRTGLPSKTIDKGITNFLGDIGQQAGSGYDLKGSLFDPSARLSMGVSKAGDEDAATNLKTISTLRGNIGEAAYGRTSGRTEKVVEEAALNREKLLAQSESVAKYPDQKSAQTAVASQYETATKAQADLTEAVKSLNDTLKNQAVPVVHKARGGTIWKRKGRDTVPAMLEPGEVVIPKAQARRNMGLLNKVMSGQKLQNTSLKSLDQQAADKARNQTYIDRANADQDQNDTRNSDMINLSNFHGPSNSFLSKVAKRHKRRRYARTDYAMPQYFADGGVVTGGASAASGSSGSDGGSTGDFSGFIQAQQSLSASMSSFDKSVSRFDSVVGRFESAVASIPTSISMTTSGTQTVVLQGGAAYQAMLAAASKDIVSQITAGLDDQIRKTVQRMPARS